MADEADIANEYIDIEVTRALGRIRDIPTNQSGAKECVECGEAIPNERRKLGFRLCIECASDIERRQSLFAAY